MTESPLVLRETPETGLLLLRLNRPERRNALNTALLLALAQALGDADQDEAIRAVILAGDTKAFAAGADIDELAGLTPQGALADPRLDAWAGIRAFEKPLIAAVEGYCLGGGFELALACDMILASESARFGLPEVKIGIMPGAGGTQVLPRLLGKGLAMKLALSGQFLSGREAKQLGLAVDCAAEGSAEETALALARDIAANAPFAVRSAKRSILSAEETPLSQGLRGERAAFRRAAVHGRQGRRYRGLQGEA